MNNGIEIPEGCTHWRCARLADMGKWEPLLWGPVGKPQVGKWRLPLKNVADTVGKRVDRRWGPGTYRLTWVKPDSNGKLMNAARTEIRIQPSPTRPAAVPPVPVAPPGAPWPAPPAYGPPPAAGYPAYPGYPPPFDPLAGFHHLTQYAGSIRAQERDDASARAIQYKADVDLLVARERQQSEERMRREEIASQERQAETKARHDRDLRELEQKQTQERAQWDRERARRPKGPSKIDRLLEELGDMREELEDVKGTTSAGVEALKVLGNVVEKFGGPVIDAVAKGAKAKAVGG
ncbi:MAG: hypothetical protein ACHQC8_06580 [Solirubrobacterales bacterium]